MTENIDESSDNEQQKPKKKWLLWAIVGGLVLLLAAGGIGGWLYVKGKGTEAVPAEENTTGENAQDPNAIINPFPEIMEMEKFEAELKTPWGKKYLTIKLALEMFDPSDAEALEKRLPEIRKLILDYITDQQIETLLRLDGKLKLKNEVLMQINKLFNNNKVRKIYITDFMLK